MRSEAKIGIKGLLPYLPGLRGNPYDWGNYPDTRGCIMFSAPCQHSRKARIVANWSELAFPPERTVSGIHEHISAAAAAVAVPVAVVHPATVRTPHLLRPTIPPHAGVHFRRVLNTFQSAITEWGSSLPGL